MEWIPVEEKLPECDKKWGNSKVVLCIDVEGRIGFGIYVNGKSQLQHKGWFTGGGVGEESKRITHWMPLVKPKEAGTGVGEVAPGGHEQRYPTPMGKCIL